MAKRDKNRSYMDWEYEWIENSYEMENKERKQKARREQRLKKHEAEYDMSWEISEGRQEES